MVRTNMDLEGETNHLISNDLTLTMNPAPERKCVSRIEIRTNMIFHTVWCWHQTQERITKIIQSDFQNHPNAKFNHPKSSKNHPKSSFLLP